MLAKLQETAAALRARGFESHVFETAEQAAAFVLGDAAPGALIAVGGSMTVKNLGLADRLREKGHEVLWHWEAAPADRAALLARAMHADLYLASANALTESGMIVQIDGTGNRVGAMAFGPKTVCLIVGRNKLVSGGTADAVRRIKTVACPANARRLGLATPCAQTGKCDQSACTKSMCSVTSTFERAPGGRRFIVLLVNEDLGY
ncbi:MAG: lactate utilization protein [Clostridia bacterium]|nr:lactate utilization protein [Clostridia bacterium]